MNEKYNPKNIDKALQRMEQADELSTVARSSTNIFQVFDEIEEEHKLQKQQSYSKESEKYYTWAKLEIKNYIENNSKTMAATMAAAGAR